MNRRCFEGEKVEFRAAGDGDGEGTIRGYAAVFDQPAHGEVIKPGAFTKTLNDGADVRALWNHDQNIVLGRTKSGTLELEQDDHGLRYTIHPPDWARDIVETIKRGDVDQSSFGFEPVNVTPSETEDGGTINEVREAKLFDVSPVTFPWYEGTETVARTMEVRNKAGQVRTVGELVEDFETLEPIATTEQRDDADTTSEPGPATHSDAGTLDVLRRRLELKAKE